MLLTGSSVSHNDNFLIDVLCDTSRMVMTNARAKRLHSERLLIQ